MKPAQAVGTTERASKTSKPSDELRIAVTFRRRQDRLGPTKLAARLSSASINSFHPDPVDMDKALHELSQRGFRLTAKGKLTASVRGPRKLFEQTFGTRLKQFNLSKAQNCSAHSFYFPPPGAPWNPDPAIMDLIDDAYIQWPHIYMGKKKKKKKPAQSSISATPPHVNYFHLEMPLDVPRLLNASRVHLAGGTGKGIRVVMIDSGFFHSHPYFTSHGYSSSVVLANGAANVKQDGNGHGTGESANIFGVAPGATFIGVKLDNESDPQGGASILEGFQEAIKHSPHVISCSMGYDLCPSDPATGRRTSNVPLPTLPNNLVALEAEIQAAVASGVVVVFSAGNGHVSFPGMMPEVISAGGVFVDQNGNMQASDYASAFPSRIYSGRNVPDFCGLVGMQPHADYIMLPIPPGCEIDNENAAHDGTAVRDGWGVFSGTSAAAPQLAGVCALLREKNPSATPAEIKSTLQRTCVDVTSGSSNSASNNGVALTAGIGVDSATGGGLVDAFAAWNQI